MQLRDYQIKALDSVLEEYDAGYRQQILSLPTGSGKNLILSALCDRIKSRLPGKVLILSHTEELIDQTLNTLRDMYPNLKIDKEMAACKADPSTADIIVASVASLGRKGTSRVNKYNWAEWQTLIIDELHHSLGSQYRNVIDCVGVMAPDSNKLLVGLTATTNRSDGRSLAEIYKKISYVYGLRTAIEDGWLVDIRGYRVSTAASLDSVDSSNGDFNVSELSSAINTPERNKQVIKTWLELGENRPTVAFTASIAHAQALAGAFKAEGVLAEAVWGDDPDRTQKLIDHKAGKIKVLTNCNVLTEGYDSPIVSCIILARPTQSELLFIQMTGRGTRLCENKKDLIVIDVCDNTSRHSLMTVPTLMGLPGTLDLKGQSVVGAAKQIEAAQEEHPGIDFTKLKNIEELASYIESVNLFEIRFPKEVEDYSEFKWYKTVDGSYIMRLPGAAVNKAGEAIKRDKPGVVSISKNMLGQWEISGEISNQKFSGIRSTMEEAFVAADNTVRTRAGELLTFINRKATWHDKPLDWNGKQAFLLKKLYPGKSWPEDLTKGKASYWIDLKLAKKG